MSKFTTLVNSFKTGKISSKLTHRQDIQELKNACSELENMIPMASGGAKKRYGTNIMTLPSGLGDGNFYELKYTQTYSYIIFMPNVEANMFEVESRGVLGTSSKMIRIFDQNGVEKKVSTLANAPVLNPWYDTTNANYQAFQTSITTAYSKIPCRGWQTAQLSRKTIFAHPSGTKMPFVVDLIISSGSPVFMVYPWNFDKELYTRNATSEFTGGDYVPFGGVTIPVGSLNTNVLSTAVLANITGAYTAGQLTKSAGSADKKMFRTITISNFPQGTSLSWVGGSIVLRNGTNVDGIYQIVGVDLSYGYPDCKFYVVCVCESTAGALTTTKWAISHWGGVNGFPRSVTTYKGRIVFGGSAGRPNTFWVTAVNSNNPSNFQTLLPSKLAQDASTDSSGLAYFGSVITDLGFNSSFNESSSGDIKWVRGRKLLHFGTNIGEHQISFTDNVFFLANMEASKVTSYASSSISTVEGDQKIFYIANNGTNIRYISTNDKYSESIDVSLSVLNMEYRNIDKLSWVEEMSLLIFKTSNNTLHGITVNEQSGVSAFVDFTFPFEVVDFIVLDEVSYSGDSYGNKLIILAKYGADYFMVNMLFDPIDKDTIEGEDYHYLDLCTISSGVSDGSQDFTIAKYASMTVGYYSNGVYGEVDTDSSGNFSIPTSTGALIIIGIPYKGRLVTADINENSKFGQANGLIKRIDRATIYLTKSGKCKIGTDNGQLYTVEKTSDTFETYSPVVELSNNPDYHIRCIIESLNGQALNISSVAFRGVTYEGE